MSDPPVSANPITGEEVRRILKAWDREKGRADRVQHPLNGQIIAAATFREPFDFHANFDGATFGGEADFCHVHFEEGSSFIGTTFRGKADFTEAIFCGTAFFWNCTFEKEALFERAKVVLKDVPRRYPGEANFSYTRFYQLADFKRFAVEGPAYFHRTCFLHKADFEEAHFHEFVRFRGYEHDICLDGNLFSTALRERGIRAGVLLHNSDHPFDEKLRFGFYNLNPRIRTRADLASALRPLGYSDEKHPINPFFELPESLEEQPRAYFTQANFHFLEGLRDALATPSFSLQTPVYFVRTYFMKGALFTQVNLTRAFFQQTALSDVIFEEVKWHKLPRALGWVKRNGLYDEDEHHLPLLQDTYHDIRNSYQKRGVIDLARDFFFGEQEIRYRLETRKWKRRISFLGLFRISSGFGRQEGLAAFWLALLVLFVFPAMWFTVDRFGPVVPSLTQFFGRIFAALRPAQVWQANVGPEWHGIWRQYARAMLRSLEACTFVPSDVGKHPAPQRLIAALERVVVAFQLTMFLIAIRWKFERGPGSN